MAKRPASPKDVIDLLPEVHWEQNQVLILGHIGDFLLKRDENFVECSFRSPKYGDFGPQLITATTIGPDAFREFLKLLAERIPLVRNECYVLITYLEQRFKI